MEYNIKKKTKHHIHLKTNNLIQQNTQKYAFFTQLLSTLNSQLDPKQFTFLTTYLLHHQNPVKHCKTELKIHTNLKIQTQPDQRNFNINQIDPTLFQSPQNNNFISFKNLSNRNIERFNGFTSTPRQRTKEIVFQNKKVLNLDKKLTKKYLNSDFIPLTNSTHPTKFTESTKAKFFIPKFQTLLSSTQRNSSPQNQNFNPVSKISVKRFTKRNFPKHKNENSRRLKTSMGSKDQDNNKSSERFQLSKFRQSEALFKNLTLRKSETIREKQETQQFRNSENSVPKQFMDHVLFSRRQSKNSLLNHDFSDYKVNKRYKKSNY